MHVYDTSKETEKHILSATGEIIDGNTFIGTEISGTMFYEDSVKKLMIVGAQKS